MPSRGQPVNIRERNFAGSASESDLPIVPFGSQKDPFHRNYPPIPKIRWPLAHGWRNPVQARDGLDREIVRHSRNLPAGLHRYIAGRPDPFDSSAAGSSAGGGCPAAEKSAIRGKRCRVRIGAVEAKMEQTIMERG